MHHRTLVPACDVDAETFPRLIAETCDIPQVSAYKLGAALSLTVGLPQLVKIAREFTDKPLIYDHQKAGTDIPDTAEAFMDAMVNAGVTSVILFPLTGPATQTAWTAAAINRELDVIVGGHMTHRSFIHAEGGYIEDGAPARIYHHAAGNGVTSFVVPGNQPDIISNVRRDIATLCPKPVFYSPGFVAQGGTISEAAKAAGDSWHAIVGRGIYEKASMRAAAEELASQL